jgi:hypothetical protein
MKYQMILFCLALVQMSTFSVAAQQAVMDDRKAAGLIRNQVFKQSQIKQALFELTDVIGPRLAGSDQLVAASRWAGTRLAENGLQNIQLTPYSFGRGWQFSHAAVHMRKPMSAPLIALPI